MLPAGGDRGDSFAFPAACALAGGGKFKIVISTDNPAVARHYKKLIKEYFQVETELEVGEAPGPKKGRAYFPDHRPGDAQQRADSSGNWHPAGAGRQQLHIRRHLQRFDQDKVLQKKSYLRGIFMGSGSVSDPARSYHLEFVCASKSGDRSAKDDQHLCGPFRQDRGAKGQVRSIHEKLEYICDTLAIMGAHAQMLT